MRMTNPIQRSLTFEFNLIFENLKVTFCFANRNYIYFAKLTHRLMDDKCCNYNIIYIFVITFGYTYVCVDANLIVLPLLFLGLQCNNKHSKLEITQALPLFEFL